MDSLVREAYASIGLPKPFLKWAGGKRQLLPKLLSLLPATFRTYREPFLGGGALFFALWREQRLRRDAAALSDVNEHLINAYTEMSVRPDALIQRLEAWPINKAFFNSVRENKPESYPTAGAAAASFIYLNRTCFNGLYRVNKKGEFNVPFGDYKNPQLYDESNFNAVRESLLQASIRAEPFQDACKRARGGDLVYFDPPYVPVSETSNFTAYTGNKFDMTDQEKLAKWFERLHAKRVNLMLSNSNTKWVRDRYAKFEIHKVKARRAINSDASKRGKITEVIITNYARR